MSRFAFIMCALLAIVASLFSTGCGSGGGSKGDTATTRSLTPVLSINWAARSRSASGRDVTAPVSALSASITVTGTGGSTVSYNQDRPAGAEAITQNYPAPTPITVQDNPTVSVTFYSTQGGAGSSGSVVATATATVPIQDDGTLATTITNVQSRIASVTVAPNQSVQTGQQAFLSYGATNTSGQIVALSPGSAFFAVTSGASALSVTGEVVSGIAGGTGAVTATVDGVVSAPAAVTVIPPPKIVLVANGQNAQVVSFLQQMQTKNIPIDRVDAVPDLAIIQNYDVLMIWCGNGTSGNVSAADADKVLTLLNAGRGVVLLGSAPAILAGGSGDLTPISTWFGGARVMNLGATENIFARGTSGSFALPAIVSPNGLVYGNSDNNDYRPYIFAQDILNPATDKVLSSSSSALQHNSDAVDALAYQTPSSGRVYWQFSPNGLNTTYTNQVLAVFLAGTNWTAKR